MSSSTASRTTRHRRLGVTVGSGSELGLGLGLAHPNANPTPTHPNQERTDKGELSHVMNINFFIDGPQADCSRTATIVELQVPLPSYPPHPTRLLSSFLQLAIGSPYYGSTHYGLLIMLQVGVSSTLNALRDNHLPYEKWRILDGIPQVSLATLRLNVADPCPPLPLPLPLPLTLTLPLPLTLTLLLHRSSSTS